jgi:FtsH-binding integral membrane protein
MEDRVKTPTLPDVNVTLIFYMFTANLFFTMAAILLAAIPYYNYFGAIATRDGLIATGIVAIFLYTGFLVSISFAKQALVIGFGAVWAVCFSLFLGFVAASIYNIATLQCLLVCWAQSLSMVVYTRLSPQKMDIQTAIAIMLFASTVVWCASIYAFFVEKDWILSVVMIVWAALLATYNVWQIKHIKGKYNLSWDDAVIVCAQYYCPI